MKITAEQKDTTLTIKLEGKLNSLTEHEFRKEIDTIPSDVVSVILDFAKLTYMSSIGLVQIYNLRKKLGKEGTLKIINAQGIVKSVLEISGTDILLFNQK
ncbi:MAG: STAS domain-containing protein [Methanocorpusculum sp.]|nr:STAS domain-containing protein [Methanocorpusculum sp.]